MPAARISGLGLTIVLASACSPPAENVVEGSTGTGTGSDSGDTGQAITEAGTGTTTDLPAATDEGSSGAITSTGAIDDGSSGEPAATTGGSTCGTIVYVHFDGITLTEGPDDARTDTTTIADLAIELAPYEGDARAEIFQLAASRFVDFDVCFTDERPADGDYTMAVVTPTNPIAPTTFGLAPTDCGNANPNNILFAFAESEFTPALIGMSIARSLAFTYGLDQHQGSNEDILSLFAFEDSMFVDECVAFSPSTPQCPHDPCRGGDQNGYQELLSRLGPATR